MSYQRNVCPVGVTEMTGGLLMGADEGDAHCEGKGAPSGSVQPRVRGNVGSDGEKREKEGTKRKGAKKQWSEGLEGGG